MSDKITTKPKYRTIKSGNIDYSDDSKVLQPKVDGASSLIELNSDKPNKIYSYRTSKRTGKSIDHSDQVPFFRDLTIPEIFNRTVLRGELYAKTDDHPMPAEEIGGILNSGREKSIDKQKEHGWLKPYIYDIISYRGKNVSNDPYKTKLSLINTIHEAIPGFTVAETAVTPEEKRKLVAEIKSGKHPDTKEGVVEWDLNAPAGKPGKLKFRDNFDVYVRHINPAVDKGGSEKSEMGSFSYSWTPKGKVVGTVGTGFSRNKRIDMFQNPDKYIGYVARVKSPQKYESGALRAPSFYTMDIEKNLNKEGSMINLEQIKISAFYDELKKIASKELHILPNILTALTAGTSSGTAAALVNKSINKKNEEKKTKK